MKILTLNKKNITDFSLARNQMLDKVPHREWVLFLDKDEKISTLKFDISSQYSSYWFTRKNFFLGHYVGSDKIIRLVQKGTGKWVRPVHEYWKPNKNNKTGYIHVPIIHNTADNLYDYLDKINKYSDLHAIANKKEGKNATMFKIIFFPLGKFVFTLYKSRNVVFSIIQSLHSFLSWTKMYFHSEQN